MRKRRPVLFIDDSEDSKKAVTEFQNAGIDYLTYHIKDLEKDCCGEVPTTTTPSVFAIEGVFKGLEKINEYVSFRRNTPNYEELESESVYW